MADLCSLCNQPYEASSRVPMVLACGHEFCKQCLLYYQSMEGGVLCKACGVPEQKSVLYLRTREIRAIPQGRRPINPFNSPDGSKVWKGEEAQPAFNPSFPVIPPPAIPPPVISPAPIPHPVVPPQVNSYPAVPSPIPTSTPTSDTAVYLTTLEGNTVSLTFPRDAYMWNIVPIAFDTIPNKLSAFRLVAASGQLLDLHYLSNTKFKDSNLENPLRLRIEMDSGQFVQITIKMPQGEASLVRNFDPNDVMWSVFEQIGKTLLRSNTSFTIQRDNGRDEDVASLCSTPIRQFDSRKSFSISVKYSR